MNGFTNTPDELSDRSRRFRVSLCLRLWGFVVGLLSVTFPAKNLAQSASWESDVIALPPLDVGAGTGARPWTYTSSPDFEVLSRCNDATTKDFVRGEQRTLAALRMILPAALQVKFSSPNVIVLSSTEYTPLSAQDLVERKFLADDPMAAMVLKHMGQAKEIRFLPNLFLSDNDLFITYAIIDEKSFQEDLVGLAPEFVKFLLTRRTPPLPDWFVSGLSDLVQSVQYKGDSLYFPKSGWFSPEELEHLQRDAEFRHTLFPAAFLFAGLPKEGDAAERRRWRAQAILFVRWAVDPLNGDHREALWNLVENAIPGGVTEMQFRQFFGFGYADLSQALGDYLPQAIRKPILLKPLTKPKFPVMNPRLATSAEIGRMKGDWERLEARDVKAQFPEYASRYLKQAEFTLREIFGRGVRDPQLLAIMGLFACDQGKDAEARPWLEEAFTTRVKRPRIYAELARLRYGEKAVALPQGKLFDATEVNNILEPIREGTHLSPPQSEYYLVAAQVWNHSEVDIPEPELAWFKEGLSYFPKDASLFLEAALLAVQRGQKEDAENLVKRGLLGSGDMTTKDNLRFLHQQLQEGQARARRPSAPVRDDSKE